MLEGGGSHAYSWNTQITITYVRSPISMYIVGRFWTFLGIFEDILQLRENISTKNNNNKTYFETKKQRITTIHILVSI